MLPVTNAPFILQANAKTHEKGSWCALKLRVTKPKTRNSCIPFTHNHKTESASAFHLLMLIQAQQSQEKRPQ